MTATTEPVDAFDDTDTPVFPDPPDDDECDGGYEAFYEQWDDLAGSAW